MMEFDVEKINLEELQEKDLLIFRLDMNQPSNIIQSFVDGVRKLLKEEGLDNKVLFMGNDTEVSILPIRSEKDRIVFKVPTGNMPKQKAEEYVNKLRESYKGHSNDESIWLAKSENGETTEVSVENEG